MRLEFRDSSEDSLSNLSYNVANEEVNLSQPGGPLRIYRVCRYDMDEPVHLRKYVGRLNYIELLATEYLLGMAAQNPGCDGYNAEQEPAPFALIQENQGLRSACSSCRLRLSGTLTVRLKFIHSGMKIK